MNKPNMGHAVIVNNVSGEFPGTKVDVEELETTYRIMGFKVHVHNNCDDKVSTTSEIFMNCLGDEKSSREEWPYIISLMGLFRKEKQII